MVSRFSKIAVPAVMVGLILASTLSAASRSRNRPISKPKFDPVAPKVEFFQGIKDGKLSALLILKNSRQGNVLIQNKTDKPITVKLPAAVVGVQVLKQAGMGMGGGGMGGGGMGGGQGGGGGGGGQSSGGGMGGGGMGGGGMGGGGMGGGMGMFSIPPRKIVRLAYRGVCLEHGKREPNSGMRYKLVAVKDYSKDPALPELLSLVARGRIATPIAQAAAWNLNSRMSWQALAAKRYSRLGGGYHPPYFHLQFLIKAREVVAWARARGAQRQRQNPTTEPTRPARGVRTFSNVPATR